MNLNPTAAGRQPRTAGSPGPRSHERSIPEAPLRTNLWSLRRWGFPGAAACLTAAACLAVSSGLATAGVASGGTGRALAASPKPPPTTSSRCVPPMGEPYSAERILQDLASGRDVDLQGRVI